MTDILYNNRLYYQMLNKLYETHENRNQRTHLMLNTLLNRRNRRLRNSVLPPPLIRTTPTIENILQHTTLHIYSDLSTNHTICPISRDNFTANDIILKINPCGHIFKRTSLLNWFSHHYTCPTCRASIIDTQSNVQSSEQSRNNSSQTNLSRLMSNFSL
jgi:hypothetical protein